MTDLRPSPIAGQWYPADKAALAQSVDAYLNAATVEAPAGEIVGLIAPHAGHRYSGPIAAHAFRLVRGLSVETVAILCPSHFHADGPMLTSGHAAYTTPLGAVEVDREAVGRLREELKVEGGKWKVEEEQMLVEIRNDREHAIEIELPFLQRTLTGNFKLIPLMLRDQSERVTRALALALTKILSGRRALIIASSDLSHYFPQAIAQKLDAEMLQHINSCDPAGVLAAEAQAEAKGYGLACGYGAIASTLWAARELGATQAKVLHHATSGDVTGDYSQVVGYGAAIVWK
jgi:AmmeMemoRadiSam system protein B